MNAVRHIACTNCGSSDGNAVYPDHNFCFVCRTWTSNDGDRVITSTTDSEDRLVIEGDYAPLAGRKVNEETCKLFRYTQATINDKPVHIAYYAGKDNGPPVAAKVRFKDKTFKWIGTPKQAVLYGQQLWRDGGKMVVITEGEIDALSVSQAQGNKWPVVSLPNGAHSAKKDLAKHLDWLEKFDSVVLMFDMDEAGQKAAVEAAELFTPGKAKIASLPLKDANDMLKAGKASQLIDAIWGAKVYRPDGIIDGASLWDKLIEDKNTPAVPYPFDGLNDKLMGMRRQELVTVTAGSGIGKSAFVREIAHHLVKQGEKVGMVMLEESTVRTAWGLIGIELNKPIHLGDVRQEVPNEELKKGFDEVFGSGQVYLYDHFGSTEVDNLLARVRYMAKSLNCGWVILDHLSIVVSGLDEGGDERKLIDRAMTMLRTLVQETGIGLILVSHLKRPDGKGHEEGAHVSLAQLRGSAAIAQLSDAVIGLERDQQGDNPNETIVRVLKNRYSGDTGETCKLYYDKVTGRLSSNPFVSYDLVNTSNDEGAPF